MQRAEGDIYVYLAMASSPARPGMVWSDWGSPPGCGDHNQNTTEGVRALKGAYPNYARVQVHGQAGLAMCEAQPAHKQGEMDDDTCVCNAWTEQTWRHPSLYDSTASMLTAVRY